MLAELKPLVPYLRRYIPAYRWGALVTVLSNAVWIFFPLVIRTAVNDLSTGVTRGKLFYYGSLLVGLAVVKGFFLFWTRWILIGISARSRSNPQPTSSATAPATSWPA
jgi:ATP-binding cassette subfamily B multidrug efflux pump